MSPPFILPRIGSIHDPIRLAVMISGGGSGLSSLLKFQAKQPCCHKIVLILADSEGAGGLEKGRSSGIESLGISIPTEIPRIERRLAHEEIINRHLISSNIELIVLSGYMRILTPTFVGKWKGRLVNIHPSLLPDFPGAHAHRDVLSSGSSLTGCTVHLVDEGVDTGPILAQREVSVMPDDDVNSLQERVKLVEHVLYPEVIDLLCTGQISL